MIITAVKSRLTSIHNSPLSLSVCVKGDSGSFSLSLVGEVFELSWIPLCIPVATSDRKQIERAKGEG